MLQKRNRLHRIIDHSIRFGFDIRFQTHRAGHRASPFRKLIDERPLSKSHPLAEKRNQLYFRIDFEDDSMPICSRVRDRSSHRMPPFGDH